jgi:hypothetical protein
LRTVMSSIMRRRRGLISAIGMLLSGRGLSNPILPVRSAHGDAAPLPRSGFVQSTESSPRADRMSLPGRLSIGRPAFAVLILIRPADSQATRWRTSSLQLWIEEAVRRLRIILHKREGWLA